MWRGFLHPDHDLRADAARVTQPALLVWGARSGRGVTVMALCPGFVKTEFHERMDVSRGSAPGFLWLDADRLVREALEDLEKGKALSIPSKRYKAITTLSRAVPRPVLARFQNVGRR